MAGNDRGRGWGYVRALAAPVLLWVLVAFALREPLLSWLNVEKRYDEDTMREWLEEARGFRETLSEMVEAYLTRERLRADLAGQAPPADPAKKQQLLDQQERARLSAAVKRAEISEYLRSLGDPTTMYSGQLPLFPVIYLIQVCLEDEHGVCHEDEPGSKIIWDSGLPSYKGQYRELVLRVHPRATVTLRYQLHAYNKRQRLEQEDTARLRKLMLLAVPATVLALIWVVVVQRRERDRERQRTEAKAQVDQAERLLLEGERRQAETERQLLEQRLEAARQEGRASVAERQALELKSQLYASIGIMAGSYAHNIKNLLVRPNDLLRRCLEADGLSSDQELMLHEVQQTLGTVTERLQQILRTVRRDPSRSVQGLLDLNALLSDLERTWRDLARDKWKVEIVLEQESGVRGQGSAGDSSLTSDSCLLTPGLWIAGDLSHLQQAVENLLFNARDATFEMRNHLRDAARGDPELDAAARRQALIAAAAWRGRIVLRGRREGDQVVLEVSDNGIGMTEEVRRRCTETHFSTKRDNAIYEGHGAGMGLGLSFVIAILEHHDAALEIESRPQHGTTFRVRFRAAGPEQPAAGAPAPRPRERSTADGACLCLLRVEPGWAGGLRRAGAGNGSGPGGARPRPRLRGGAHRPDGRAGRCRAGGRRPRRRRHPARPGREGAGSPGPDAPARRRDHAPAQGADGRHRRRLRRPAGWLRHRRRAVRGADVGTARHPRQTDRPAEHGRLLRRPAEVG
jgi:signal transduction histidine kinase